MCSVLKVILLMTIFLVAGLEPIWSITEDGENYFWEFVGESVTSIRKKQRFRSKHRLPPRQNGRFCGFDPWEEDNRAWGGQKMMKRRSNELLAAGRSLDNIRPPTVVIRSGVKIIKPINNYCQRHNGPKALSTQLTHSTPFIQSRSFNLVQLQLCFVWLRTRHT